MPRIRILVESDGKANCAGLTLILEQLPSVASRLVSRRQSKFHRCLKIRCLVWSALGRPTQETLKKRQQQRRRFKSKSHSDHLQILFIQGLPGKTDSDDLLAWSPPSSCYRFAYHFDLSEFQLEQLDQLISYHLDDKRF